MYTSLVRVLVPRFSRVQAEQAARRCVRFCLSWLLLPPATFAASRIEIVDASGSPCFEAPVASETTFFVNARLGEMGDGALSVAEFRISGLPSDWLVQATPNPEINLSLGQLFGSGVTLSLVGCAFAPVVNLFSVAIQPTDLLENVSLAVAGREPPTNFSHPYPQFWACSTTVYRTEIPAGEVAVLNPTGDCTVQVESLSWQKVKMLFR